MHMLLAMKPTNDLIIYHDRMAVALLKEKDESILNAFQKWRIGKVDSKERIHFCGLVRLQGGRTAVFLPRHLDSSSTDSAKLTMEVLSRFGKDSLNRDFISDGDHGNSGVLAVIAKLATDFRQNGLFVERQRIQSRNSGKPDWKRTVVREQVISSPEFGDIYQNISTTKAVDSADTFIARVQAVVMTEIIDTHGWWLDGIKSRRSEFRWIPPPHQPRKLWPLLLVAALPRLYSKRSIFLATFLAHYLRETRESTIGDLVAGVEDFHTIWEVMLRRTLKHVENDWNERLPRAVYTPHLNDIRYAPEKRMLTDIILQTTTGFTIVDAKYYDANSETTVPGWPDIAKQMLYETALRSVVGEMTPIKNCFAFPARTNAGGPYKSIEMRNTTNQEALHSFPSIECHYISIINVMRAYKEGRSDLTLSTTGL